MSRTYIPRELRQFVRNQAKGVCEYCLIHERYTSRRHQIDHIISIRHRGETTLRNLCLSCFYCNQNKGGDIASLDPLDKSLTPLFNPRTDVWDEHFRLNGARIEPITAVGRVTEFLLRFNDEERLIERARLLKLNRYPR